MLLLAAVVQKNGLERKESLSNVSAMRSSPVLEYSKTEKLESRCECKITQRWVRFWK